jgi:cellobiose-specific phosphotransferase system component IIB
MRRAAQARGLDLTIDAGSSAQVPAELDGVTAVLVGAHLAEQFPALQADAVSVGVPTALLPTLAFDAIGAATALDVLDDLLVAHDTATDTGSSHG